MKMLVTGGLGFIGSNFCKYVLGKYNDYEVFNVDKVGKGANLANLKELEGERRYTFIKEDVCNANVMDRLVRDVDVIVNMAAETHVDRSISCPKSFVTSNTLGTFTILEAIRKHADNAILIQVSTDEIYGQVPNGSFKEKDAPRPSNPYSASKAAAEMFTIAYKRTYGLNIMITRCTNNYGPYQMPEKLIPKTIIRALKNAPVPIYGSGKNIRDWLYVQDHCEALCLVLSKGQAGEIYNISSGNEMSNVDLVRKVLDILGKPTTLLTFVEDRPGHDSRYSLDSSKIRSKLGWQPKFSFHETLRSTASWYIENEWWWKPLATEKMLRMIPWKTSGKH